MRFNPGGRLPVLRLAGLTVAALLIHGYHLGVEDGEIYVPAAKKLLHPEMYPYATEFFLSHGHMSLFSPILAATARLTHLSMDWTVFGWYVASLFAMLASCWMLAAACFSSERARWSALLIVTAVLTMPATNTALLLIDPYLTARSLSTPLTIFALAAFLERKYVSVAVAIVLTASVHPQMVMYLVFLAGVMAVAERARTRVAEPVPVMASAVGALPPVAALPTGFYLAAAGGPYREALYSRDYYFLANWEWYHWLGLLAPLAILAIFWKRELRGTNSAFQRISFAMLPFGLLSIAVALVFSTSHAFDMFARLQPLRSFHLITLVFILLLGGIAGEYLGRRRPWIIAALAIAPAIGMFVAARMTYPDSPQVELPGLRSSNAWVNTMLWVRGNTPVNAVFAIDSRYFQADGVDLHGFRSGAERSALADYYKDGGVVSLFPALAPEWKQMSNATTGLDHFTLPEFQRLRGKYPMVSWTVIHGAAPRGLVCPYQQQGYAVCRLDSVVPGPVKVSDPESTMARADSGSPMKQVR